MCVHAYVCCVPLLQLNDTPLCRRQTRYRRRTARRLLSSVRTALRTKGAFASRRQRVLRQAAGLPVELPEQACCADASAGV